MNTLLEDIFRTKQFRNSRGEVINICDETSRGQCEFLKNIIIENDPRNTLEIGFAYGISTLAIIEEVAKKGRTHCVIDKFQTSYFGANGVDLIKQAGYAGNLEFFEKFCYEVLPEMMLAKRQFDFAYVDSTKQLDWLLVDFFYLDKMLTVGGIIVFDDVWFPGIRKLLRYISKFPNYKVYARYPNNLLPTKLKAMASWLRALPLSESFLKSDLLVSDYSLGINANCVALQKIGEDKRDYKWHVDF